MYTLKKEKLLLVCGISAWIVYILNIDNNMVYINCFGVD